jgi:hypothetical protein
VVPQVLYRETGCTVDQPAGFLAVHTWTFPVSWDAVEHADPSEPLDTT